MTASVLFERRGGLALVQLNRPDSRNALSTEMKGELERIVSSIAEDKSVRSLVLTGSGKAFCAGTDLNSWGERSPMYTRERLQGSHRWIGMLARSNVPIVTAINGIASGAGLGLALLGDLVIAASDARFQAGFPRVGAVPDFGVAWALPRIIGLNRAKDLLLTNRMLEAAEALAIGLVARVVDADRLLDEALVLADSLAKGPSLSLGLTKGLFRAAYSLSMEQYLEGEAAAQAIAIASADFGEGVAAFLGRRQPIFNGN